MCPHLWGVYVTNHPFSSWDNIPKLVTGCAAKRTWFSAPLFHVESLKTTALWHSWANHDAFPFQKASDLADMITRVIREGLEGLVLKDTKAGSYLLFTEYAGSWGITADRSVDEAHKADHPWNLWVLADADTQSKLLLIDLSTAVLLQC